jgi:MFS family permease
MLAFFSLMPTLRPMLDLLPQKTWYGFSSTAIIFSAQAFLQTLFLLFWGIYSDRCGRLKALIQGLILGLLGTFLCGIGFYLQITEVVLAGRILQGIAAVSSVITAFLIDITPDENRTKILGLLGASIGISFLIALSSSSSLLGLLGLSGFWVAQILIQIIVLAFAFQLKKYSNINKSKTNNTDLLTKNNVNSLEYTSTSIKSVSLPYRKLMLWYIGVFCLHLQQAALFVILPKKLEQLTLSLPTQWKFYLPLMILSFFPIYPLLKKKWSYFQLKITFMISIIALFIGLISLQYYSSDLISLSVGMITFFLGFNFLESQQPSQVGQLVAMEQRGKAMGIYNTLQSLGIGIGAFMTAQWGAFIFPILSAVLVLWFLCLGLSMFLLPKY